MSTKRGLKLVRTFLYKKGAYKRKHLIERGLIERGLSKNEDKGSQCHHDFGITNKLTDSMTSKNTSFFLYLMPCPLHDTAFVKASGGRGATCSL